ncbi:hypothetical protein ACFXPI_01715 [Streptomyces sp. NPDC059104]|uniref:hypothetical protein n=1 Tax=Streptomyces sp. NPDC059104 TaxID=3346729 RepID=UPI0036AC207A
MRRGSAERIVVGGIVLAVVLALAGWGAGQVGYEPPSGMGGLERAPSLADWLAESFASVCARAAPVLVAMAVIVQVVTWIRFALAVAGRRGAASAGPVVPESAEVRAHADRHHPGPGRL